MIGIVVQLLLSWLIIWLYQRGNLSVLGWSPNSARVRDLFLFMIVTVFCCSTGFVLRKHFGGEDWVMNPAFTWRLLLEGIWWNLKSVLFEELIFRGVLFYILIKLLGTGRAMIVSSACFGIYHWFSYELFGNPSQMAMVFLITGAAGLLYAYGFVKTGALYATVGIHFGWNFTSGFLFSEGSIGNGLLVKAAGTAPVTVSYFIYFLVTLTPFILFFLLNYLLLRKRSYSFQDMA